MEPRLGSAPVTPGQGGAPGAYAVEREDDFDFTSPEYADLHSRAGAPPFQHGVWLGALFDVLVPRRHGHKVVVTVRDAEGRLALVLPLVKIRRGLLRVLEYPNLGVSDYAVPVLDPRAAAAVVGDETVVQRIRAALGGFDILRVAHVPDRPDIFLSMLVGARAVPHSYRTHMVDLPDTVEAWHHALDPAFVRHLERKYKRLRPKGEHRLRVIDDPTEVEPMLSRMRQFRAARFAERGGVDLLQDPDCFAFYCAAARGSVAGGPARLLTLEIAGEPAVVVLDLVDATSELFVLVGYDFERLRNASLGLIVVDELTCAAIGRGVRHLDLTVGDEHYKAEFGAHPRPLFEVRACPTLLGAAGVLARDHYLRARRVAKEALVARRDGPRALAEHHG